MQTMHIFIGGVTVYLFAPTWQHLKTIFHSNETHLHLKIYLFLSLEWSLQLTMHMSLARSAALHYNIERINSMTSTENNMGVS